MQSLEDLIATMRPVLNPGRYVYSTLPFASSVDPAVIVASIREPEGLSVVLAEQDALRLNLPVIFVVAWITLRVASELSAIGFTAAFARALGEANISCNVVAGTHHDHIFVPHSLAQQAMDVLQALQASSSA